jgi:hypothetical protein
VCLYLFAENLFSRHMREMSDMPTVEYENRKDCHLGLTSVVSRQLELTRDAGEHSVSYNAPGRLLAVLEMD